MISMNTVELKDLEPGKRFRFPRPTMLTGVYFHSGRVTPANADYFYVHEVGVPGDVFVAGERSDVIPEEETVNE